MSSRQSQIPSHRCVMYIAVRFLFFILCLCRCSSIAQLLSENWPLNLFRWGKRQRDIDCDAHGSAYFSRVLTVFVRFNVDLFNFSSTLLSCYSLAAFLCVLFFFCGCCRLGCNAELFGWTKTIKPKDKQMNCTHIHMVKTHVHTHNSFEAKPVK